MTTESATSEAGRLYSAAYSAHYASKDLRRALELYWQISVEHPESEEARDARAQIENIVRAVVPEQVLFETQISCALEQFQDDGRPNGSRVRSVPVTQQESN